MKHFSTVVQISRYTNQIDLNKIAKAYLQDAGIYNRRKTVGDLVIWCRYDRRGVAVAVGPTEDSVTEEPEEAEEATA